LSTGSVSGYNCTESIRNRNEAMMLNLRQDEALELWRETLSASVRDDGPDLSARQMAILLTVYTSAPPHTVKALAGALRIAKPAVTRALDRLSILGFVRRARDQSDRRIVHVQRTVKGAVFLSEFADQIAEAAEAVEPRFGPAGGAHPQ
jgi:DNA-binding MarR family transcriptional regulator